MQFLYVSGWSVLIINALTGQNFSRAKNIFKKLLENVFMNFSFGQKNFTKNFRKLFPEIFPAGKIKKSGTGPTPFNAVNPHQKPPSRTPIFPVSDHPQSGPCTCPDSPKYPNRALYAPGLGSADPLFNAKVLEDYVKQGVRMIVSRRIRRKLRRIFPVSGIYPEGAKTGVLFEVRYLCMVERTIGLPKASIKVFINQRKMPRLA